LSTLDAQCSSLLSQRQGGAEGGLLRVLPAFSKTTERYWKGHWPLRSIQTLSCLWSHTSWWALQELFHHGAGSVCNPVAAGMRRWTGQVPSSCSPEGTVLLLLFSSRADKPTCWNYSFINTFLSARHQGGGCWSMLKPLWITLWLLCCRLAA